MTDTNYFLDSSIWLGYFLENIPETALIVESENTLLTSIISMHEVYKKLSKIGNSQKECEKAIQFIEDSSVVINLDKNIVINSVKNCEKYDLHTIDSLIYSSAEATKTFFVTADKDFRKTPKTIVIKVTYKN